MDTKTVGLTCRDGTWEVCFRGDRVMIADPQGRCRHVSHGHESTAIHLAMRLADMPFNEPPENLDQAMKMSASRFRAGEYDG